MHPICTDRSLVDCAKGNHNETAPTNIGGYSNIFNHSGQHSGSVMFVFLVS